MKVGILAGGVGSRLAEETVVRPKPMIEIGGRPILWHIMMHYSTYGFKEFVVALGYKGECIKRYMADYCSLAPDLRVSLKTGRVERHGNGEHGSEDWVVDLIDTGQPTNTGGRIKRLAPHLGQGTFMLTWGDGVSNVNLTDLMKFHRSHGRIATVTAVRPPARFGRLELDGSRVARFDEKPLSG
ncbi:MAG TPA: sugar phosphate nucleotidyltransferase, partial [Acetobacteraceae bacterium]|nr:sugar phosphate nucleotidyltransferase [Acetobacteraceae bacterium]